MSLRQGRQACRGTEGGNAVPSRARSDRVTYTLEGGCIVTPEVPYDVVYKKKNAKHGVLSARRALQKAKMSLKSAVTGFGCVTGCLATIVYPDSEREKTFLLSMDDAAARQGDLVDAAARQGDLVVAAAGLGDVQGDA